LFGKPIYPICVSLGVTLGSFFQNNIQ